MVTPAGSDDGASAARPKRARQGLILVVEECPQVQDMARQTLQRDYELISLSDGQELMDAVAAYNPDLIVLGSALPTRRFDGRQLYKQLRAQARCQDIPVIFLSPASADAAFMKALVMHGDAYLIKPFGQKSLWDAATRLIAAAL